MGVMETSKNWQARFQKEISRAENARLAGNEGMARVCARRAAGIVIGEYLRRQGSPAATPGAYDRLKILAERPDVSAQTREVSRHMLLRITPEHELPVEADLVAEARWLAQELLGADPG